MSPFRGCAKGNKTTGGKGNSSLCTERSIVEITFAWFGIFRRLMANFEVSLKVAKVFIADKFYIFLLDGRLLS